jgi:DNA processing protein
VRFGTCANNVMSDLNEGELRAWLRLVLTPGVGRETARKLLQAMGAPTAIFESTAAQLAELVSPKLVLALQEIPPDLQKQLQASMQWLSAASKRQLIVLGGVNYPQALLDIEDPPVLLFAEGDLSILAAPLCVAVVGSRSPSPQGALDAHAFAAHLAAAGITVVSGLARGIDTAAHEGALSAEGATIAVVATGLDEVYPPKNTALARSIAQTGLLLSEYLLGTRPLASNFPQRNRIISGLSAGTLVVEAALKSGSLITARMALEQGKDVFAIPGSIHSPVSKGCHLLIKQGAKLVETAEDILEEFNAQWTGTRTSLAEATLNPGLDDQEVPDDPILKVMGFEALTLDELQDFTGLDTPTLQIRLLELELAACVMRLPGGRFQRVRRA